MLVQVNRFKVQHNGETFVAGDVFEIDDVQGKALIESSDGELSEHTGAYKTESTESEEAPSDKNVDELGLPKVSAKDTVGKN